MKEEDTESAFEKGLCWALYRDCETELLRFFEYVPYTDKNRHVYSPKLLDLLMRTCGYIDDVFKQMLVFKDFTKEQNDLIEQAKSGAKEYNIFVARDAFQPIYDLSSNGNAELIAKLSWFGEKPLRPFEKFSQSGYDEKCLPDWWHSYNKVKHKWSSSIEQANMVNVLDALAGAFLLNVVHYPSVKYLWGLKELVPMFREISPYTRIEELYELVRGDIDLERDFREAIEQGTRLQIRHKVETQLFRYLYEPQC